MFIVLVVIHFSEIRALRAFEISGWAREESRKKHDRRNPLRRVPGHAC